jgi:5-formyltetrahydrofolate cyclo-ligase
MNINKNDLRQHFLAKRKIFDPTHSNPQLNSLLFHFLEQSFPNNVIGAYYPIASEANILPTVKKLLKNWTIGLPLLSNQNIEFHKYTSSTQLTLNKYNCFEPLDSTIIQPTIILTPLIAVDLKGDRLGYGKGLYDRYFGSLKNNVVKIGICYNMQITDYIPAESHDIPLNLIITENNIHYCQ